MTFASESRFALLTATALGLAFTSPAYAQDGEASATDSGNDIIVTARRTEERLQDVPISMTVLSQEQIASRNIVTGTDLATYTPSLTINQRFGPEKSSFVIRGFTQEANTAPSVGVYFADVTAPRAQGGTQTGNGAVAGAFFDLQNVQVLKGPQGTLFGRNTTGGAVLLVPQKPTDALEGFVEGTVGDYDLRRVQAVLNVPLADTFKVRLGVDRNQRDGYMKNHSGIGPKAYNDVNYFAARLSIVADLTPDLENYIVASYNHSFGVGYAARFRVCDATPVGQTSTQFGITVTQTAGRANNAYAACEQIARQAARGDGLLDVEVSNRNPRINLEQWQVINTTTWKATDDLTIKNITSYAEFREGSSFTLNSDNFFVPAGRGFATVGQRFQGTTLIPTPGERQAAQSTFTEEFQLQGVSANGRLNWQAGAYLEISHPLGFSAGYSATGLFCTNLLALECLAPLNSGQVSASATKTYFNNKGFYAQATFALTEQLSLTGGVRYTIDKMRQDTQGRRFTWVPAQQRLVGFCNNPNLTPAPATPAGVARSQCRGLFGFKTQKPTWLIDVDYKPLPDVMLYAKWSRGYRQGGINGNNVGFETWGPEKVEAYEVGAKTSFRSGSIRGYFNVAGYWNDFTDQQINVNFTPRPPSLTNATAIINAGKSRIRGFEVDGSVTLFDDLRIDLGYAYTDTRVINFIPPDLSTNPLFMEARPTVANGSPLTYSPKNRVTLTGTYTLPLDESIGQISFGATYTHTDTQRATTPSGSPFYLLPATDLVNLNLDWKSVLGQPVDFSLFVTNLTNQIYEVGIGAAYASSGFEQTLFGQPRMFGARLRYRFGD